MSLLYFYIIEEIRANLMCCAFRNGCSQDELNRTNDLTDKELLLLSKTHIIFSKNYRIPLQN